MNSSVSCFGADKIQDISLPGNSSFARGAFGEISLAIHRESSSNMLYKLAAIKTLHKLEPTSRFTELNSTTQDSFSEAAFLKRLSPHPNIIELLAVYQCREGPLAGHTVCLAFRYCPVDLEISLEWRRRTFRPLLSMTTIQTIATDLFNALAHCHGNGILHRDIKISNLLVARSGHIQLCDFGIATSYDIATPGKKNNASRDNCMCTLHYRPPEVLLGAAACNPSVDIYAAGVSCAELLSGSPLFPGVSDLSQLMFIFEALGTPTMENWPLHEELPDWGKLAFASRQAKPWPSILPRVCESVALVDFFESTICLDPAKRKSATDCQQHTWLLANHQHCKDRSALLGELVPKDLSEPLLLAPPVPDEKLTVMNQQVLQFAAKRRGFLASLETWNYDN